MLGALEAYQSEKYKVMLYKDPFEIGIRKSKGIQVFSFGRKSGLGEKDLRAWADKVLKKLDEGMSEGETMLWIRGEMAKFPK